MKKVLALFAVLSLVFCFCKQKEAKSPIEGTWKLVYFNVPARQITFPGNVEAEQIKMWTATHFSFDGLFKTDTIQMDNYGWGTYTLEGNKYIETIKLFPNKSNIGNKVNILLEVNNDTLIQRYPVDDKWNLQENYRTEKYVRIE